MSIYIGGPVVVSDMQGPAPSGFHVPLNTEWQGLKTIMDGLGLTTGDNWRINLHMPFAGRRLSYSATDNQGSRCCYWSSSPRGSSYPDIAYYHYLNSSTVADYSEYRTRGFSVRCFKDSFELPTSSWTVIQGTLGGAGIFWNQSEELISITNGTTGYTIMDKNLGATTLYSDGDTLSEANCGYYYQRGNNYGFAFTGTVTNSTTQVNASTYGPGTTNGYYESGTFITRSSSPYDWSSVQNDNLRGGVSQGSGTKSVEVKNIYIGEYSGRLPIGYKEVEYIQSSGTQYIDTGYTPNKNVKIEMDFAYTSTSPTQQRLFGVRSASTSSFTFDIYINGGGWYGWSATDGEDGVGGFINTYITVDTNKHTVIHSNTQTQILTNGTSIYNNTRTGYITTGNNALGPIPLFAGFNYGENPNGYSLFAYLKIYSCKIWNGDTLVRELVPCYRKSDSVIGMYDLVNNQFYTNSGSGTFTKGPDVN